MLYGWSWGPTTKLLIDAELFQAAMQGNSSAQCELDQKRVLANPTYFGRDYKYQLQTTEMLIEINAIEITRTFPTRWPLPSYSVDNSPDTN